MSIYVVILDEPSEEAWAALEAKWPGRNFRMDDRVAFVAPPGEPITTTADVAGVVGVNSDEERQGIVLEHLAHTGFARSDLWEWLRKVR